MAHVFPEARLRELERECDELRARNARLERELDSVVAIVHDRAPELLEAVVAVAA